MDSKHRHQLEQNALAKWLIAQYEGWIRPNSSWLGYACLGVLIVIVIVIATARVNSWNQASAWKQYYAALYSEQSEADLEVIADSTSGAVGIQARLALAQRQLSEGCTQVFTDKALSIAAVEKAIVSFEQVQEKAKDSLVLQRAGFGLGQCWEALAAARVGDDLARAEEEYQKVADRWGEEHTGLLAKQQLARLRQPSTKQFMQLAAAKKIEPAGAGDFNVNIDPSDPFAAGKVDFSSFDQKEESSEQKTEPVAEPEKQPEAEGEQKPTTE
jgi:hypothetical protein